MKKIFAAVLTAVLLCLSCVLCFAAEGEEQNGGSESLTRISDQAGLLTTEQREKIEDKLAEVRENRDFDIVIVTAESAQGKSEMDYADDFFDYNGYGCGTGRDGVLLLVNMGSRKTWISTHGEGIRVFTDKGIECILSSDGISSYLSRGDYYGAFEHFIELCDDFIAMKRAGKPYDIDNMPPWSTQSGDGISDGETGGLSLVWIPLSLIIGFVIALLVVGGMKSKLKSVHMKAAADDYIVKDSMNITQSSDVFLYKNVVKRARPKNDSSSSSGGGSSTHTSSSGSTHGGGGGSF